MASLVFDVVIEAASAMVWDAVRDFGAVHERLVPGFLTDAVFDGQLRTVTFFNGMVVRERLVGIDDEHRRVAYTNELPGIEHHSASVQVFDHGVGACRLQWITDVLPDLAAGPMGEMMQTGIETMQRTLEGQAAAAAGRGEWEPAESGGV